MPLGASGRFLSPGDCGETVGRNGQEAWGFLKPGGWGSCRGSRRSGLTDQVWLSPQVLKLQLRSVNLGAFLVAQGLPGGTSGKEPASQCRRHKRGGFDPCFGKIH